jgi:hypothetical protein
MSHLHYIGRINQYTNPDQVEHIVREYFNAYEIDIHVYDNHLMPQHMFLKNKDGVIDNKIQIIKQETLCEDMISAGFSDFGQYPVMLKKYIAREKPGPRIPIGKPKSYKNYYAQMNMNTVAIINRWYKDDFALFTYDMITTEEQLRKQI